MKESDILVTALKSEMDAARAAFADRMAAHMYGSTYDGTRWVPPVYTRRQRLVFWLRGTSWRIRERVALWIAPWLDRGDE